MNTTQPRIQIIEIQGYKLPRYQLHLNNSLGEFFLSPVLPSSEYLLAHIAPEYAERLKQMLADTNRGYAISPYQSLFAKSRMLTSGGGQDSFFSLVQERIRLFERDYQRGRYDVPDQLQILFENDSTLLEQVYPAAIQALTKKSLNPLEEHKFIDAFDKVIEKFIDLLRMDGRTGVGELRLLEQLYRKQVMFGGRILAIDLPLFMREGDLEIDKLLTSLLALGWSYEFDAAHYQKSFEDVRQLTKRFLRLYLMALTAKVLVRRDDEAEKYSKEKERTNAVIRIEDLTIEHEDGSLSRTQFIERALSDNHSEEAMLARDEVERLMSELSEREQEIVSLLGAGNTKAEIARKLGISDAAVGQTLKRIRERRK